jgi:hypothetical protein
MESEGLVRALSLTVGSWGAANLAGGVVLAAAGRGAGPSAFGQQCAAWGTINLAIAGIGAVRGRHRPVEVRRLRTILLVNAALDVGYMAVGAAILRANARATDVASEAAPPGPGSEAAPPGPGSEAAPPGLGSEAAPPGLGSEAQRPARHAERDARIGHGAAVIVQGAALGLIDTVYALAATRVLRQGRA